MKKLFHRFISAVLIFGLFAGMADAGAVRTGDPLTGHWAEETIRRAISDGLIVGDGESVDPDAAVSGAQMITILCRVLSAARTADLTAISDVRTGDWYYIPAAQAVALGIVTQENGRLRLDMPVTRGRAFDALAEAFQLAGAKPDTSPLTVFSDRDELTGRYKIAASALIAAGYVRGDGNALHINSNISLAEFLTILYRIIPNYNSPAGAAGAQGGLVLSGNTATSGGTYSGNIYFDCSVSSVVLQNTEAPCAVVRSDSLQSLTVNSSRLGRLVLAAGGGDISYYAGTGSTVGTVVVGDGGGTVTLGGGISAVEVTGDRRNVVITGAVQTLLVSGSGCKITVNPNASVAKLQILGAAAGNAVTVSGSCGECRVYGEETSLGGSGTVTSLVDYSSGSKVSVFTSKMSEGRNYGLGRASLTVSAPQELPSYKSLNATVAISAPGGMNACLGLWSLDDVVVSRTAVEPGTTSLSFSYPVKNTGDAPVTMTLSFALYYEDAAGGYQERKVSRNIVVENLDKFDIEEVLSQVTTAYQGDYTLEWAQSNDYDEDLKTAWVNFKGYSSKTAYLIWINLTYQRVNIFSGSAGNWTLEKSFLVGTGAPGSGTPRGVYAVFGRSARGWTTATYTVKPVVNFYSGYAFHSRLYAPGTTNVIDARIGFPISHGCIRMYDEDIQWIYDNIPTGTTVVVH